MTTSVPPNTATMVPNGATGPVDTDLMTVEETKNGPTFAVVTARSYHPGGVNALLAGGSVRSIKSSINGLVWRALGTVGGGEVISAGSFCSRKASRRETGEADRLALKTTYHM